MSLRPVERAAEIRFGDWTLLRVSGELLRDGRRIRLQDHPLKVLEALLERPGELVTREQLITRLWPNQVVEFDTGLNSAVRRLRAALGDDADVPRYVETIPRRGYRFVGPITVDAGPTRTAGPAEGGPPETGGRRSRVSLAAAAAALAVLAWLWLALRDPPATDGEAVEVATPKSIVVLPFVNMSPSEEDRLFADGLTEELINRLAGNGGMRVIARTSSFAMRDESLDIPAVAERLRVSHVLEGSVRRSGDQVRVTAQLIDATDSGHVWSQHYDRTMGDLFGIQDDIASHVATALEIRLDPPATGVVPPDPAAYEKYLIARHLFGRRGPGDVEKARDYFEEATGIDPTFARAWAGLSSAYFIQVTEGAVERDEGLAKLEQAANRSISLDPSLAEPHLRLANRAYALGDETARREHWRLASELEPDHPLVLSGSLERAARLRGTRDPVAIARQLVESDPLAVVSRHNLSWELYATGRFDEALVESRKVRELSPAHSRTVACYSLIQLGRFAEARELAEDMSQRDERLPCLAMAEHGLGNGARSDEAVAELVASFQGTHAFSIAEVHAFRGDPASAFHWLQRNRDYCATEKMARLLVACMRDFAHRSPMLAPLQSDPRWEQIVASG